MKRLIFALILFLSLVLAGSMTTGIADTVSTQTTVTITIKQAPAIVPAHNQYLPDKGKLPRTSGQTATWWELPLGMLCFLEAGFLIHIAQLKRRKTFYIKSQ